MKPLGRSTGMAGAEVGADRVSDPNTGWALVALALGLTVMALALVVVDAVEPGESLVLHGMTAIGVLGLAGCVVLSMATKQKPFPELRQLLDDRDAARAASAAKSRYLASVSHEIRSPLNAIYGYAQLVEQDAAIAPQDAARVIRRSAEHLTNLVEGLLDIASVEQGVVRIDNAIVRLGPMVEQVADMFEPLAAQKNLAFFLDLPDRLPEFVRMDVRRVRQVLINLLSNAVKFTPAGEIALSLRWAGQMATFEVRDTGPGISQDCQEQVFAPYARAEGDGEGGRNGAGLGLAITRAIVHMLGGDLQVESVTGEGSCFRVCLMMPQVSGVIDRSEQARRPDGYRGRRRSILLVDDTADHLAFLRAALGEIGFEIAQASDGHTALAMAREGQFDAAVLDVSMPGMSGWELAAHLRADHGRDIAILMLSANAEERNGVDGQAPDHDEFLLKPIDLTVLIDALGRRLALEWTWPERALQATDRPSATLQLSQEALNHVERIRDLVRTGHVRALEGEIRELEQGEPGAKALVARLYDCLDRFDLAAIPRILEDYR